MSYQNTFKRYELKYLLTGRQKEIIQEAMENYMKADDFGRSTICNIYFDTSDFLLIRRSMEKPVYKEKLRLRSYGRAKADGTVFVELKKKYKSVVYKRRVHTTEREAMEYLCKGKSLPERNQITEEIDYAFALYKDLQPAVYLSYEREAFYGKEDRELRITFDENILWRNENLSLCAEVYGEPILEPGYTLMEVKIAGAMPLWLVKLLSENHIYKTSFSKYGCAYTNMIKNKKCNGGKKYA